MAAAVTALAAPLLLLTFSALLNDSNLPESGHLSDLGHNSTAEQAVRRVLTSQRSDEAAFRRHRALAERFVGAAASHLRRISPLFADAAVQPDGGAYEDTRVSNAADFDMYTVMAAAPLRQFELQRGEDGSFAVRLRHGASRRDLPEDLINMLTDDGYLDGRRFRQWTTECLMFALYEAAAERPDLRPAVYHTRGAPGVNLTAADGARVEVDFTAKLPLPPTDESMLRPAALRPCGVSVAAAGGRPPWHLYSSQRAGAADRFGADAPRLELRLLRAAPLLRDVIRLLKTLRASRDWHHRFYVRPFQLKQAALWSWAARCDDTELLPATVAALRRLEEALRRRRLRHFWFAEPAENVLQGRVMAQQLADEVAGCVDTLTGGDAPSIRRLFQPPGTADREEADDAASL